LISAAGDNQIDILKYLLEQNAFLVAEDANYQQAILSAIETARIAGRQLVVDLLEAKRPTIS